ncbi:MAG: DUF4377 domain-containing protein [Bacteroidales bacterium]|nr:DUF4377 domain-containing protein [Bacteroidales bacterium]
MNKIILITAVIGMFFLSACQKEEVICDECNGVFTKEVTIFVDGYYTDCGEGDNTCFFAQEADVIDEDAWEVWTADICGFEFEPAYRYQLTVKKEKIDNVDGEKIYKYCLVRIDAKVEVFL